MSTDDQEVEAWYLEGWCFYLMAEQAQENGGSLDELTWQELAKDSRDCLETCQVVSFISRSRYSSTEMTYKFASFTEIRNIPTDHYSATLKS